MQDSSLMVKISLAILRKLKSEMCATVSCYAFSACNFPQRLFSSVTSNKIEFLMMTLPLSIVILC